jgi:hypothetical protein
MLPAEIFDSATEAEMHAVDAAYLERYDPDDHSWRVFGPPGAIPQHWDGETAREFLHGSIRIGEQLGPYFDVDNDGFIMALSPMIAEGKRRRWRSPSSLR